MIRVLDRYLLRHFLAALLVVTLAIGLTIIVINMVEELRDFIDHKVPLLQVLEYYLYFGGWVLRSFLPMFVLLALLFSVSILARRNEILAMKANGLSLYRITWPFLVVSILIAIGHFYYNEYVFPPLNQRRLEIKAFTIERKSKEAYTRVNNIFRQIRPGSFYTIGHIDTERGIGRDFKLYITQANRLVRVITAPQVTWEDFRWIARDGLLREFDTAATEKYRQFDTLWIPDILEIPKDFLRRIGKPEDMGLVDLQRYIDLMKRAGGPYQKEKIDLQIKYAYPVSSVVVVLICLPFASNPRRGGIAVSFAMGAMIALLYFILFRVMQSAGYNEKVPDLVAVWAVNGAFFVIGSVLMLRARK